MKQSQYQQVIDLITKRRSLRAYDPEKEVPDKVLYSLFEAARWAPSAFNEQPWRFIYTRRGTEAYDKLFSTLAPSNQLWVRHAPVLIFALTHISSTHNGEFNRHAAHDLGLAMGMLSVQATALGINLHQMGGFDHQKARELFNIPPVFEGVTITAAGYPGSAGHLPENLLKKETAPRTRKELSDFVFQDHWPE